MRSAPTPCCASRALIARLRMAASSWSGRRGSAPRCPGMPELQLHSGLTVLAQQLAHLRHGAAAAMGGTRAPGRARSSAAGASGLAALRTASRPPWRAAAHHVRLVGLRSMSCRLPLTALSRLLKSCAMPLVSWPTGAARRWRLRSRALSLSAPVSASSPSWRSAPPGGPCCGWRRQLQQHRGLRRATAPVAPRPARPRVRAARGRSRRRCRAHRRRA